MLPGTFYFDNDRHCTNAGGIGALALRVGTEISRVLATGTTWTLVPKSVRLTIHGKLQPGVYARERCAALSRQPRHRSGFCDYRRHYRPAKRSITDTTWNRCSVRCRSNQLDRLDTL